MHRLKQSRATRMDCGRLDLVAFTIYLKVTASHFNHFIPRNLGGKSQE